MRNHWLPLLIGCYMSLVWPAWGAVQQSIHHALHVVVQPAQHTIQVTDQITLPEGLAVPGQPWQCRLHAALTLTSSTPGVHLVRQESVAAASIGGQVPVTSYTVVLPPGVRTFTIRYQGPVHHAIPPSDAHNAWSMPDTPGLLTAEGVYLSTATAWYPQGPEPLLTFTLEVQLPAGWEAISQGQRTQHRREHTATFVRWESPTVQEEVYLVGGPLTEYRQERAAVQALVFLRTPDAALARTYLEATERYIHLYSTLLGPYPYTKFALVENSWESGYGMPSFTLLGSKVMRLPFVVTSSYAHEIVHNWWGNGVFVEAQDGNWCEGVTAYLADHLLQEQCGHAVAYRRATLQRYTDYVTTHNDLPLAAFRGRHNAATAAIGYGKALMLFHMLRQQLGDAAFVQSLRTLYRERLFQRVDFFTVLAAFASPAGMDTQAFFQQWVRQAGAPELRLRAVTAVPQAQGFQLRAVLEQIQPGPAYRLLVPLAISLEDQVQAWPTTLVMTDKRQELVLSLPARPWRVDVDPEFDLFRRLHREELPPALSQMLGAERALVLLPSAAPAPLQAGYRQMVQRWAQAFSQALEIRLDHELTSLPADDRPLWLIGWDNRWLPEVRTAWTAYGVEVTQEQVRLPDATVLRRTQDAVVLTARHPQHPQRTFAWVAADNPAALPGLSRKVPHYGTYSFVGFTGEEPTNTVKGHWPVFTSPLSALVGEATEASAQRTPGTLPPRRALVSLP